MTNISITSTRKINSSNAASQSGCDYKPLGRPKGRPHPWYLTTKNRYYNTLLPAKVKPEVYLGYNSITG